MRPVCGSCSAGSAGSAISGSVTSTSRMRSAEAAARGTIIIVITAIITENRICMM